MDKLELKYSDMTVGAMREFLDELSPLIRLVEVAESYKAQAEFWERTAISKERILKTIVDERDNAIKRLNEYKKGIQLV